MRRIIHCVVSAVTATTLFAVLHGSAVPADPFERMTLEKGDHICLLGNALAERMQHHGWLETRLQARFPGHELSFRNLGFSADELTVQQRTAGFGTWDDYLTRCKADVVFGFFGYNESFAGQEGLDKYRSDLAAFIDHTRAQSYNGKSAPRLVLFSSIPHEDLLDANLPDPSLLNARLALYAQATATVARAKKVPYVDLMGPMTAAYDAANSPLTINSIHLNDAGNRALAKVIERALFPGDGAAGPGARWERRVREEVLQKNLYWFNRYRATDGFNVYGGRSHLKFTDGITNRTVLQREMEILDAMCNDKDREIWALAQGREPGVIESTAPPPIRVETNKPGSGPGGRHEYLNATDAIELMTPAPGMHVNLFADEKQFPALANPVQMAWDTRGRLWVAAWPTYPHWEPGQPINDKLLILEDTDGDGKADECKVFAEDLHNPTGFEFWNGGVIVANCPDLLFLKDTDGDDKCDTRERILHGLSSADTHHAANSFVIGPMGALYFQEGTFHQSQVETVYGPVRCHNGCSWRFEPRTWKVERYTPYNFANPHGHVFDRWGQGFLTDGTGNVNYYELPFSGHIEHPAKHSGYFPYFKQRSRPCAGTEILSSSHFPAANQGNHLIANVIGFQGIFQYRREDDGSGFKGVEVDPIVYSSDPRFRPSDIEVGPDGAIYFLDWYNPIIGHMQHHLRDPSRDHSHGRVYRVTYKGRPLTKPAAIHGRPIPELLELLKSMDDRVRYRTRIELSARKSQQVAAATVEWIAQLDPQDAEHEHHVLEGLWLLTQHNIYDRDLLKRVLRSKDYRARAAATRVLRVMRGQIHDALDLLAVQAKDEHPRVRLEAVVAASFFDNAEAAAVALEVRRFPTDKFLEYALKETMRALDPIWKAAIRRGELIGADNPAAMEYLLGIVSPDELVKLPRVPGVLKALLTRHGISKDERLKAASDVAKSESKTVVTVVMDAIRHVDAGKSEHARHVLHELGMLVQSMMGDGQSPRRDAFAELAAGGQHPEARQLGYAGMIALDGNLDTAWASASKSRADMLGFLGALPMVMDAALRASAYERVRPVMFQVPASLGSGGRDTPVPGVRVGFYRGTPKNARLETFKKLSAEVTGIAKNFSLDIPQVRRRDAFGLMFSGTIHIPKNGRYVFFTNSDDGSRLYIDGEEVVSNDGAHGMREKRGAVRLARGPHNIVVTYYDQGGGDGLVVSWRGPGFRKQRIPDGALTADAADTVRAAAVRAVAHIPGHEPEKFRDAARLIGEGLLLEPAIYLVDNTPRDRWPAREIESLVDSIAAYASQLPKEQQTAPYVVAALDTGRKLATALPEKTAEAKRRMLAGLGGSTILVRTVPHQMLYDRKEFWVETGKPVAVIFQNNDVMPHNLVITKPGAMKAVGMAAEAGATLPGAQEKGYIPDHDGVLWYTKLIFPGETTRLTFVAPDKPGDFPYVCTFPGHWTVMNGVMHVVEKIDPAVVSQARPATVDTGPARRFVKMWTVADLAPSLKGGWEEHRNRENGRKLFGEAGCNKCHWFDNQGIKSAPDLTETATKYKTGVELLKHIIDPSASILEGYESWLIETSEGDLVDGRIVKDDGKAIHVNPNLQKPDEVIVVPKDQIEDKTKMTSSAMPTGLLVTLNKDEILDLLAYLRSAMK